jgi:pectin lyase
MNKLKNIIFCLLIICSSGFAANRTYPVSEVNLGAYNTTCNLNITGFSSGSPLNIYAPTGNENEDWRINYISDGVFEIENSTTGLLITAGADNVARIAAQVNNNTQRWQIAGVTKDFLGEYLYYKIINSGNGKALTFSGNTVILADYTGGGNQLWRLDLDGLEGFGALCKVNEGLKAGTIGGLLGKTVFVSNLTDLRAALANPRPLTIVLTANLDFVREGSDMRIDSYKTLIGSFSANTLTDARLVTNYYGWANPPSDPGPPSDNIVIKNMTFPVKGREDVIVLQVYSGKNVWVDHNTFYSTLGKAADEVGKFIWINTPSAGPDITRNPDFVTLSYNVFRNRYWCVAYGTQNTTTSEDRTTVAFNIWDSNVRRTPQIGNGSMHTYNNFNVNNSSSVDNAGYANVIPGDGSFVYSEANRFEGFKKESSGYWDEEFVLGSTPFKDVGSYTNKSASGSASVTPYLWSTTKKLPALTWNPRTNYGYKLLKAYNSAAATDARAFNQKYSGSQSAMTGFRYITDSDVSAYVAETVNNPFLITPRTNPETFIYQYNATAANDAWESVSNWTPARIPAEIDTAVIRSGEVKVYDDLGTFVKVEPNGIFRMVGTITVPRIALQGGTLKVYTSNTTYGLTSSADVQKASVIVAGSQTASVFWLKGTLSGNGNLTKSATGILDLNVDATSYSGNWYVNEGTLRISNNKSIGSNTLNVSAGATLEIGAADVKITKVNLGTGILNLNNNLTVNEISINGKALSAGKYISADYPGNITGTGTLTVLGVPDCAGVLNGTAIPDNCGRCVGGTTGKTACASAGEAETDACSFDGVVESSNAGFKGTGYINFLNEYGSEITFQVNAETAGSKTIGFRYANGGTNDRTAMFSSGSVDMPALISFPPTGSFSTYKTAEITLFLNSGVNLIRLYATTSEGMANIDQIVYVSSGLSKGICKDTIITGVAELSGNQFNELYPNPSSDIFFIRLNEPADIEITDAEGRLKETHSNVSELETGGNLRPGIYFVRYRNTVRKFVKY